MATFAAALRDEVRRLATKQMKKAMRPFKRVQRQVKTLRTLSRRQRRTIASLERRVGILRARAARALRGAASSGARGLGVSPEAIRALRGRFKMTRVQFAKLVGVSAGSIFGWETGRTVPRGKSRARVAELRKLGVREARRLVGSSRAKRGARRRAHR